MAAPVNPQIFQVTGQEGPWPTVAQPPAMGQTTVVIAQPPAQTMAAQREWSTGICGCFDDMGICLYAMCCPSCYFSNLAADMGESCIMPCCVPTPLIPMRAAWRNRHHIRGSIQNDCCAATFCYLCALCQLGREVKQVKHFNL